MEEKLMELYESIANEHDPQELRTLIQRLTVLLGAKEQELRRQELRDKDKTLHRTATPG
jgi:hypothetical protein